MREKEIVQVVEKWLSEKGYLCRREVRLHYRTADLVGFKPPNKFLAVEVKSEFDDPIRGMGQAIAYGNCVDESYLVIDKAKYKEISEIIRYVPLGVLVASRKGLVLKKKSATFKPKTFWKDYLRGVFLKDNPDKRELFVRMPPKSSPEIRRLVRSVTIESLWYWILRVLEDTPCHAYILSDIIKNRFDFKPNVITCYKVLYFLEKGGYVKPRREGNRKIYIITKKGEREMEEGRKIIDGILD